MIVGCAPAMSDAESFQQPSATRNGPPRARQQPAGKGLKCLLAELPGPWPATRVYVREHAENASAAGREEEERVDVQALRPGARAWPKAGRPLRNAGLIGRQQVENKL